MQEEINQLKQNIMNAKELRIGNYVEYANVMCEVKSYSKDGFLQTDGVTAPITAYQPIEISERWLLKFGFEKVEIKNSLINKCYYHIDDFEVEFHGDRLVLRIYGGESAPNLVQYFAHHTKYIHQLQNIYFALTNEELTIK